MGSASSIAKKLEVLSSGKLHLFETMERNKKRISRDNTQHIFSNAELLYPRLHVNFRTQRLGRRILVLNIPFSY